MANGRTTYTFEIMIDLYKQYKVCSSCEHKDQREIPANVAAFEERRKWTVVCSKCGCKETTSSGLDLPDPTRELMAIWAKDESLSFFAQDEDICLAQEENIALLIAFLDSNETLAKKKSMLLAALCVLIYDNTPEDGEDNPDINIEIANRVAGQLKKRLGLFVQLDTSYIMDYIKKTAYPQIGLPVNGM